MFYELNISKATCSVKKIKFESRWTRTNIILFSQKHSLFSKWNPGSITNEKSWHKDLISFLKCVFLGSYDDDSDECSEGKRLKISEDFNGNFVC